MILRGKRTPTQILQFWIKHGLSSEGSWNSDDTEFCTTCPFCSGNTFHVNSEKGVFHCKECPQQGSFIKFLEFVHEENKKALTDEHLQALADSRHLPTDVFRPHGFGWNAEAGWFTLAIYNMDGEFSGIQTFEPKQGAKLFNTYGTKIQLWNGPALKEYFRGPVIITEGAWDGMAMQWLLKEVKEPGTVVAVPGCNTNLTPWLDFLRDRDVIILYDHDKPAMDFEEKAYQLLETQTKSLGFIHWPLEKPKKYDIRDHISKHQLNPKKAYHLISKWLRSVPRNLAHHVSAAGKLVLERREDKLEPLDWNGLVKAYREILHLPDTDALKVVFGTIFANRLRSGMVWVFMVAPSSSGKSEILLSLEGNKEVEMISRVTPQTFVSGWKTDSNTASLFEKLKNRMAIWKDFTPMLELPIAVQAPIFGILRDAYDGEIDSMYGNMNHQRFKDLRFGIIAGTTGKIEELAKIQRSLGERFLKYYMPIVDEDKANAKMQGIMMNDKILKTDLKFAVRRFLSTNRDINLPTRSTAINEGIKHIAKFTSRLRGVVPRDWRDRLQYTPEHENSMRLVRQFTLVAIGLASLEEKKEVGEEELRIIRKIALDSCPDITEQLVYQMYQHRFLMGLQLEQKTGFPYRDIKFFIDDLKMLKVLEKQGSGFKSVYSLSDEFKTIIKNSCVYAPLVLTKERKTP